MTTKQETDTRLLMRPLNWLETQSEEVFAYILLFPAFLLLAVVAFFPLIRTFQFSLLSDQTAAASPFGDFVGFDNYAALLTGEALLPQQFFDPSFGTPVLQQALFVTLAFAILSVLFETLSMANASVTNSACWSTGVPKDGSRNCCGSSASPASSAA